MPYLRCARLGAVLIGALLLAVPATGKGKPAPPRLQLQSAYLAERLGSAHRVRLVATLGGRGRLTLDGNRCTVGPFGDAAACTEMAPHWIEVGLIRAKVADPEGRGRALYRVVGPLPRDLVLHLVVPQRGTEAYRLVADLAGGRRRVVTLEPLQRGLPPPPQATLCRHATYRAERMGSRVVIHAGGRHPSLGYKTYFERLPLRVWPPQFKLVCMPPRGMAGAAMTPFEVETSFDAGGTAVREVIVHDARGRHRVPVP